VKKLLILAAAPAALAGTVVAADRCLRAARPVTVPDVLVPEISRMEASGWRRPRWHSLACRELIPHTHLIAPGGGLRLIARTDGKIALAMR
jgi:hypothetical protein